MLLVEDDHSFVQLVKLALKDLDFELEVANDGLVAQNLLSKSHFDLIMCDDNGPNRNLIFLESLFCFTKGLLHPSFVRRHISRNQQSIFQSKFVRPKGFEPPTSWSVAKRSVQVELRARIYLMEANE